MSSNESYGSIFSEMGSTPNPNINNELLVSDDGITLLHAIVIITITFLLSASLVILLILFPQRV